MLPWMLGFAGTIYGATALICGVILVAHAVRLHRSSDTERRDASRLFVFSIFYLFALFAALLADHSADRWSSMSSAHAAVTVESSQAAFLPSHLRAARSSVTVGVDEV